MFPKIPKSMLSVKSPYDWLEQTEETAKRRAERLQWFFKLEKQKMEQEVEDAKICLHAKNLKASSDNLSVNSV